MQILILISYSIAFILFIISLIFEKRITILDLIIAVVILAIPVVNILMFTFNVFKLFASKKTDGKLCKSFKYQNKVNFYFTYIKN